MNDRRWLLAAPLLVLGLGLGVHRFLLSDDAPPTESAPAPTARAPQAAAPSPDAERPPSAAHAQRAWVPGTQFVYGLDAKQQLSFTQQGARAGETLTITFQGEFTMALVGGQGDRLDTQVQVRTARFDFQSDGRDALDAQARQRVLGHLQQPFYVTYTRQGAALLTHFEREVDPLTQNLLRSLVASTQFVKPLTTQTAWEAQELDVTGQYVANYQPAPGERQYERRKVRYLRMSSPQGLRPLAAGTHITVDATTHFGLGEEGWPETVHSREHVAVEAGPDMPTALADSEVRLTRSTVRRVPALIGSLELRRQHLGTSTLATQVYAAQDPKADLRRLVAGAKLTDLVGALRALPPGTASSGEETSQLMNRLRALFTLEPDKARGVPEMLRGEKDRNVYSSVIGSLSAASTPDAVNALAQVMADGQQATPTRVDAAAGLGMAPQPTQEGIAALRELAQSPDEDLRSTATLALGNAARNLNEQSPAEAAQLLHELGQSVATAPTPEARALRLRALGNTASPEVLAIIQDALRDTSPLVREAAIEALRLIPGAAADQLLAMRMLEDPAPQVRRAAIFASSFRPLPGFLPFLERTLRTDAVDAVRNDVVRLLGEHLPQLPGAVDLLAWASQNDPNSDIRHTALAYLAPRAPAPQQAP
ncbi:HEAT repeat domain-containing protein [Myxococcus sp. AB036A]|uniref:HEAT repeat domain-containing protein n=1 Tax=Myxococcus sp. AB036A TaxID=2562793 RepID=UPI00114690BB|nr:HEAT repeat domain-containing protein [Myxococcus sp. AB036A]